MFPNGGCGGWHYLAVKKLPALLRRITFKNNGDFYCLNCLRSFRKNKTNVNRIKKYKRFFKCNYAS